MSKQDPNIKLADKVINRFAYDLEGLNDEDLEKLHIKNSQARTLKKVLETGAGGIISDVEASMLKDVGFKDAFISELRGNNDTKAIEARQHWLMKYAQRRILGKPDDIRGTMIQELGEMGPLVNTEDKKTVDILIEEMTDPKELIRVAAVVALGKIKNPTAIMPLTIALDSIGSSPAKKGERIWPPSTAGVLCQALYSISAEWPQDRIQTEIIPIYVRQMDLKKPWPSRQAACEALGKLGPKGASATLPLIASLQDPEWWVRNRAAWALGQIGPNPNINIAITPLILALGEWPNEERRVIVEALSRMGNQIVGPLTRLVHDSSTPPDLKANAIEVLGRTKSLPDDSIRALVFLLKDPDPVVVQTTQMALMQLGTNAMPELLDGLATTDESFRLKAKEILKIILINEGREGISLADAFFSRNNQIRQQSVALYGEFQKERMSVSSNLAGPKTTLQSILQNDPDLAVRSEAAKTLGLLEDENAVPFLVGALKEGKVNREVIETALIKIGDPSVPAVLDLLKNKKTEKSGADILVGIGSSTAAKKVVEALQTTSFNSERDSLSQILVRMKQTTVPFVLELVENSDRKIHDRGISIFREMGPDRIPDLAHILETGPENLWEPTLVVLDTFGPQASPVVPQLIKIFKDPSKKSFHPHIMNTLAIIDTPAISLLIQALLTADPNFAGRIKQTLINMGEKALPELIQSLTDEKLIPLSPQIEEIIVAIGKPALPSLASLLEDFSEQQRDHALSILSNMGELAVPLLLERVTKENDPKIRGKIWSALSQIGIKAKPWGEQLEEKAKMETDADTAELAQKALENINGTQR